LICALNDDLLQVSLAAAASVVGSVAQTLG
jgi:hypothetical protein